MQKQTLFSFFSLFTSTGTLICCALPALFIALGMGAVLAGIVSDFPQIIWLSENKAIVFGVAGAMLVVAGALNYYSKNQPCPIDPILAQACKQTRKWSARTYFASVLIYIIGAAFAFIPQLLA